jgi:succinate-semialdehyde dehydrogenase / glutarate-semialdehyde dehydrogenase
MSDHTVARPYADLALLVGGERVGADDRATMPVEDPATTEHVGQLPTAATSDVERALAAAHAAFPAWRSRSPAARAEIMHRAADLLRERVDEVAVQCTRENGKILAEARDEVAFSADIIDFFAAEGRRAYGTVPPSGALRERVALLAEPIGPVAAFTPWNYPVTVPARKVSAAIAAGCTVLLKASEETPASAMAVVRALTDAGLPTGVVNLLFSADPATYSRTVLASPVTRMASFTGSTVVGREIGRLAGQAVKPCMLELGSHTPVLVFPDANLDRLVEAAVASKLHNAGQSCGSPTRFYVHESVHDEFVARFVDRAAAVVVGDGLDPASAMGPLANARRRTAVRELVRDAVDRGARLELGGTELDRPGHFFPPTVLADVPEDAIAMNEEPFGPVALTARFATVEEAIAKGNRLPFGLTAYIFTEDLETATVVPRALEAGMVGINTFEIGGDPDLFFGGVKESGHGSDGGPEALRGYQVPKLLVQA